MAISCENVFGQAIVVGYKYVLVVVCISGVLLNVLNVFAFSRRSLRNFSLYNLILALSISDALALAIIIPDLAGRYSPACLIEPCEPSEVRSECAALIWYRAYISYPLSNTFTTVSMWMTVIISLERLVFVRYYITRRSRPSFKTPVLTRSITALVVACSIIFHVPLYFSRRLSPNPDTNSSLILTWTELTHTRNYAQYAWSRTVLCQLAPASILLISYAALIRSARQPRRMRGDRAPISPYHHKIHRVVTRMVLSLIVMFLVTDVQTGFTTNKQVREAVFSTTSKDEEKHEALQFLGNFLELIGNSVNFFIYCRFNKVFKSHLRLLWRDLVAKVRPGGGESNRIDTAILPSPPTGLFSTTRSFAM